MCEVIKPELSSERHFSSVEEVSHQILPHSMSVKQLPGQLETLLRTLWLSLWHFLSTSTINSMHSNQVTLLLTHRHHWMHFRSSLCSPNLAKNEKLFCNCLEFYLVFQCLIQHLLQKQKLQLEAELFTGEAAQPGWDKSSSKMKNGVEIGS